MDLRVTVNGENMDNEKYTFETCVALVAFFSSAIAVTYGCFLYNRSLSRNIEAAKQQRYGLMDFRSLIQTVSDERRHIIQTLMKIGSTPIESHPGYRDSSTFFSTNNELSQLKEKERASNYELIEYLNTLLNSYPKFDASLARGLGYVRGIHQETEEHHTKVMTVFNECIRLIEVAEREREYLFKM